MANETEVVDVDNADEIVATPEPAEQPDAQPTGAEGRVNKEQALRRRAQQAEETAKAEKDLRLAAEAKLTEVIAKAQTADELARDIAKIKLCQREGLDFDLYDFVNASDEAGQKAQIAVLKAKTTLIPVAAAIPVASPEDAPAPPVNAPIRPAPATKQGTNRFSEVGKAGSWGSADGKAAAEHFAQKVREQ